MSYTITTTAGATLATVTDGTVNTTSTSLTLIGKNYAGYGIFLNENYIKLLENFSYSTAPSAPLTGQLWYDSTTGVLKVYNGSIWKPISSSASGSTAPTSPVTGDLWWDSANAQLKVWSSSAWITIGPAYTSTAGTSGAVVETVLDSGAASHVIVKFYISNTVVAILSKDQAFTPQTSIAGFSTVNPGFNLISSSTISNSKFTGDVSNALALQGVTASQFMRNDQNTSTPYIITAGGGLTVGSDLDINTTSGTEVRLDNVATDKDLNFYVAPSSVTTQAIRIVGSNAAVFFGGPSIQAAGTVRVAGATTLASTLSVSGNVTLSSYVLPPSPNSGTIGTSASKFASVYATTFYGTAVTAQYADLAERFEADVPMVPGTVVELGGLKEVTAAVHELSEAVFGVISTAAGFLMNGAAGNDKTHPPIAVNGRVPVRVVGQVKKGDRLVSAGKGLARAGTRSEITAFNVIGRALDNKLTDGEGTVEAIVKLNS